MFLLVCSCGKECGIAATTEKELMEPGLYHEPDDPDPYEEGTGRYNWRERAVGIVKRFHEDHSKTGHEISVKKIEHTAA